ncbi:MAG: UDP-3-O-(3-hydroxymyristoyl)glucosamine N-acyltransferase [Bacteroidia bacterium]
MKFSAQQIAAMLDGKVEGNPAATVSKLSKIEEGEPNSLSFLGNPQYTSYIYTTAATIVIVNHDFVAERPLKEGCTLIRVAEAREAFAKLLEAYNQIKFNKTGIEKFAFVSESATVGENSYIGSFAYISDHVKIGKNVKIFPNVFIGENTTIGDNTIVFSGVQIYSDTVIGKNCDIHGGVVIGGDGFGFTPQTDNNYKKVPQIGNVVLEDFVEIGANTTIDRATLGSTILRRGVKLDNLIQIAHNVEIGENTVVASQTGVSGSTKIGKDCMVGGQVGIIGHLTIANKVKIAAQSGVGNSILTEGDIVQGSPAFSIGDYKRAYVVFRKLPELQMKIKTLENTIAELKLKSAGIEKEL